MIEQAFTVEPATWQFDQAAIQQVRTEVFIVEQEVPEAEEWDNDDPVAQHFLALDNNDAPIGTARLTPDGRIGRVAVVKAWRGQKVGDALLRSAIEVASLRSMPTLRLAAQTYALQFYARHGFQPVGDIFKDVGIDHQWMERSLAPAAPPAPMVRRRATSAPGSSSRQRFEDRRGLTNAWSVQLDCCRRRLNIFTHDLDPRVLDQPDIMARLRDIVVSDLRPEVRILVVNSTAAAAACHPLISLAQRLPSVIQIRRPGRDHQDYPSAFSVADEHHVVMRPFGDTYDGYALLWNRLEARRMLEVFLPMWEAGSPDPNFRRLAL